MDALTRAVADALAQAVAGSFATVATEGTHDVQLPRMAVGKEVVSATLTVSCRLSVARGQPGTAVVAPLAVTDDRIVNGGPGVEDTRSPTPVTTVEETHAAGSSVGDATSLRSSSPAPSIPSEPENDDEMSGSGHSGAHRGDRTIAALQEVTTEPVAQASGFATKPEAKASGFATKPEAKPVAKPVAKLQTAPAPEPVAEVERTLAPAVAPADAPADGAAGGVGAADEREGFEAWLSEPILRGVQAFGFETPSPVQQQGIPLMLGGSDVLIQALSGSGKTGAFVLSALEMCQRRGRPQRAGRPRAIILCHTKELVAQTATVARSLGAYMKPGIRVMEVGSKGVRAEQWALRDRVADIVVGTPVRLAQLVQRRSLCCAEVALLVMDECDALLDPEEGRARVQEFWSQAQFRKDMQVAAFSATVTSDTRSMLQMIIPDRTEILLDSDKLAVAGIEHYFVEHSWRTLAAASGVDHHVVRARTAADILCNADARTTQTVVFVNSKARVEAAVAEIAPQVPQGMLVAALHSGMDAAARQHVIDAFRRGEISVLVGTDALARGLDVQGIGLVINLNMPYSRETYVHRAGRSGRFGRKGVCITLVDSGEEQLLDDTAKAYGFRPSALMNPQSALAGAGCKA